VFPELRARALGGARDVAEHGQRHVLQLRRADHCSEGQAMEGKAGSTARVSQSGQSERSVRADSQSGQSERTVRADSQSGQSEQTVRADSQSGQSERTVGVDAGQLNLTCVLQVRHYALGGRAHDCLLLPEAVELAQVVEREQHLVGLELGLGLCIGFGLGLGLASR
jgi:hypothetical protein